MIRSYWLNCIVCSIGLFFVFFATLLGTPFETTSISVSTDNIIAVLRYVTQLLLSACFILQHVRDGVINYQRYSLKVRKDSYSMPGNTLNISHILIIHKAVT